MSWWTWTLIALCAAGVALPLYALIVLLSSMVRFRRRLQALQNSRLFIAAHALGVQQERLGQTAEQIQPLLERTQRALETIRRPSSLS